MAIEWDLFALGADWRKFQSADSLVAKVPPAISDERSLFSALAKVLYLPDYFGENWDALLDVLRDFSWVKQRDILLVHADIPNLSARSLNNYLHVLSQAVKDWPAGDRHRLVVYFPCNSIADFQVRVGSTLGPTDMRS